MEDIKVARVFPGLRTIPHCVARHAVGCGISQELIDYGINGATGKRSNFGTGPLDNMGLIPLLIFGTGGHAREILGLVQAVNAGLPTYQLMGWLDDRTDLRGNAPLDVPMLGKLEDVYAQLTQDAQVVIAIGNGGARKRIAKRLDDLGIRPATLVHPTAYLGPDIELGPGTMVCAGAILTAGIEIGQHAIINTGAIISHECRIGDYATISPGVNLAGNVHVETGADVGVGASVLPGLTVGSWSIVGGGAVVTKRVPVDTTVIGTPARVIKQRSPGWQHE